MMACDNDQSHGSERDGEDSQSDSGRNDGSSSRDRDEVREKSAFEEDDVEPENYDQRHSSEEQDYIYGEVIQAPKSHKSHSFGKNFMYIDKCNI